MIPVSRLALASLLLLVFQATSCAPARPPQPEKLAALAAAETSQPGQPGSLDQIAALVRWYNQIPPAGRAAACRQAGLTVENLLPPDGTMIHFKPASDIPNNLLNHRALRAGAGLPILAWRDRDGSGKFDSLRPEVGIGTEATAVLDRTPGGQTRLRFISPLEYDTVRIGPSTYPLAADFSAHYAGLTKAAHEIGNSGLLGMLRPDSAKHHAMLTLLDPYDPTKIPVLFTHGLQSTPVAFSNLANDLRANPEIRKHCQFWVYYYPTGRPVIANAAEYRRIFRETLKTLDPGDKDFATHHILVLGHSMGGVISHTLVSDSGWSIWDATVSTRPGHMSAPPATIAALKNGLIFKRDPHVTRVIFASAPHRGSSMADNWVGSIGQALFRPDFKSLVIFRPLLDTAHLAGFYLNLLGEGKLSSIRTLSPHAPDLIALSKLPIRVPYHTIIGQKRSGPAEKGSDGVVPYTSSHLDGAASELVVRSGHSSYENPAAVKEIERILLLQIKTSNPPRSARDHTRHDVPPPTPTYLAPRPGPVSRNPATGRLSLPAR